MSNFDLGDYVDVKTRIELFYDKFPEGRLQFEYMGVMDGNPDYIWGIARAYRSPDDVLPVTGTCSELAQGKTTYTKGSELANLETSAIGRAIGALGIGLGKSMASKQEVQAAKDRQAPGPVKPKEVDPWALADEPDLTRPVCVHGLMERKTGLKKDGTPYAGWICGDKGASTRCDAIWDRS